MEKIAHWLLDTVDSSLEGERKELPSSIQAVAHPNIGWPMSLRKFLIESSGTAGKASGV